MKEDVTFSKLNYARIQEHAARLRANGTSMEQNLMAITNQFNRIGSENVWSGTAASETKSEFDALSQKFESFHQAVTNCATYLDTVVENYKAVDNTILGK